jgi:hypothetical protein
LAARPDMDVYDLFCTINTGALSNAGSTLVNFKNTIIIKAARLASQETAST